jgi:protein-disulfide isomerase
MYKFKFRKKHNQNLLIATAVLALVVGGTIYLFGEFLFFGNLLAVNTDGMRFNSHGYQTSPNDPLITMTPDFTNQITSPVINSVDPSLGATSAKVNIVQFSRFNCSFCQQQENILRQALNKYGQDVKLIHKDYPEKDITAVSYQAAVASRCAAEQGKFWEYGAELYKYSQKLSSSDLAQAANALQLDNSEFQSCLNSGKARQLVNDNLDEGDALEITGVPFVYVNQQKVTGEITIEELDRMVNDELKNK